MKLLDGALGIHGQALTVRTRRLELLAQNIANADTPNFKARDIDFRSVLAEYQKLYTTPDVVLPDFIHQRGFATSFGRRSRWCLPDSSFHTSWWRVTRRPTTAAGLSLMRNW